MAEEDAAVDDDTLRILVATDSHIGFNEKDKVRGKDALNTFEEVLQIARGHKVDLILHGGDLFHDNKPSRSVLYRTMELMRRYCFGPGEVQFQVVSDPALFSRGLVNYEDPNVNVEIPFFMIHGNHDDPGGESNLSAANLLEVASLVNYFGRAEDLEDITVRPVMLRKGRTQLALYGLGNIRDERLNRAFQARKVRFETPVNPEQWFNVMILHQNRHKGNKGGVPNKACIHEQMLPNFLDLVLWGHEHDCLVSPQESLRGEFYVVQPGSSVATSLTPGETALKHVAIIEVRDNAFRCTPVPLWTVRPLVMSELSMAETGLLRTDAQAIWSALASEAISSVHGVVPELIEVTLSLAPDRHTGGRRLQSEQRRASALDVVVVTYTLLVTESKSFAIQSSNPSEAVFQAAIETAFAHVGATGMYTAVVLLVNLNAGTDGIGPEAWLLNPSNTSNTSNATILLAVVKLIRCGDGAVMGMETCDDGNEEPGDGCNESCQVEHGWYCEDVGQPCKTLCGDGLVGWPRETCDDGNKEAYDGCGADCLGEMGRCAMQAPLLCFGSLIKRADVSPLSFCAGRNCTLAECCTLGRATPLGASCLPGKVCATVCGDGHRVGDELLKGRCDDGNLLPGDGCDASCNAEPGWHCEPPGSSCHTVCGDGAIGFPVEECDDGNIDALDGCGPTCRRELGRCADQAESICIGGYRPRSDVPPLAFCGGPVCTERECCVPNLPVCPLRVGVSDVVSCVDAFGPRGIVAPEKECGKYKCPAGWSPRSRGVSATCMDPRCKLATCCLAAGVTCTCANPGCCAQALSPPHLADLGSTGGLEIWITAPVSATIAGRQRWYHVLGTGAVKHTDLRSVVNGSLVLKGYRLKVPTLESLEALFAHHPVPNLQQATDNTGSWHLWTSTPYSSGTYWALRGQAGRSATPQEALMGKLGRHALPYAAFEDSAKYALLEVSEAITVVHGGDSLLRVTLRNGGPCCFNGDDKSFQNLPAEAVGATFFALDRKSFGQKRAGVFTIITDAPATVLLVAVYDWRHVYGAQFESGFPEMGWERVPSPDFRLSPLGYEMGCWRRTVVADEHLQVSHLGTMYGSVAVLVE